MTLVRKDSLGMAIASVLLCAEVCALLFMLELLKLPSLNETSPAEIEGTASVARASFPSHRKAKGEKSWFSLAEGTRIFPGDRIMTSAKSSAKIVWEGGTMSRLEGGALLEVPMPVKNDPKPVAFTVVRGVVAARTLTEPIHIQVGNRLVKLHPKSELLISVAPFQTRERIQVKEGVAEVPGPNTGTEDAPKGYMLREGEVTQFDPERGPAKILTNLSIAPTYPQAGQKVMSPGYQQLARFKWNGDIGDTVELDRTSDFSHPVVFPAKEREASVSLGAGKYYWRAAKGDLVSQSFDFMVMPTIAYHPLSPVLSDKLFQGDLVKMVWVPIPDAQSYELQISRDASFHDPFLTKNLFLPEFELTAPGPGHYYWRYRAIHAQLGPWPYSDNYPLRVAKGRAKKKRK